MARGAKHPRSRSSGLCCIPYGVCCNNAVWLLWLLVGFVPSAVCNLLFGRISMFVMHNIANGSRAVFVGLIMGLFVAYFGFLPASNFVWLPPGWLCLSYLLTLSWALGRVLFDFLLYVGAVGKRVDIRKKCFSLSPAGRCAMSRFPDGFWLGVVLGFSVAFPVASSGAPTSLTCAADTGISPWVMGAAGLLAGVIADAVDLPIYRHTSQARVVQAFVPGPAGGDGESESDSAAYSATAYDLRTAAKRNGGTLVPANPNHRRTASSKSPRRTLRSRSRERGQPRALGPQEVEMESLISQPDDDEDDGDMSSPAEEEEEVHLNGTAVPGLHLDTDAVRRARDELAEQYNQQ